MVNKNIFHKNPLLRLAIPLIAGIAVGWVCNISLLCILLVFIPSVLMLLLGIMRFAPKWLFGIGAMMLMFALGLFVENRQASEKTFQWSSEKKSYTAHLVEMPVVRGTNVKVLAEVVADSLTQGSDERSEGLVYLYFQRTVDTELLSAGDMVAFEAKIIPPENQGNPAEFDVENYYYIKGISGTVFVPERKWRLLPEKRYSLPVYALRIRAKALAQYKQLGFEEGTLALLSALTLGEKRDFPKDLKESYSVAGASHILALSGLHLGVLYMLLAFIVPMRGHKILYRLLRETLILAVLWAFAFVAGLSPSVLRAATLFTLMSMGRLLGYDVSSVSSLSFAAIVMLLFSPHLLFDISFQLSFAAVLAILLLAPPLQKAMRVYEHGVVYGYVVNLFIISVVAQVGVMPFVWYYFGVFPVYFLLTNLFIVPLAFVVIMMVVVMWLLAPVPLLQSGVAWLLSKALTLMNMGVDAVASLPGASSPLPPLDVWGAVGVALFMVLLLYALYTRRRWLVFVSSSALLLLVAVYAFLWKTANEGNYMLIYNNRKNPLLHLVFEGGENYLVSSVPQLDAEYEYVSKPFLQREGLTTPRWVDWEYNDSLVQYNEGGVSFEGVKVRLLDHPHWIENECAEPVDILVLCRGFLGRIDKLVKVYPAKCVVVDGSLYKRSRERIKREYSHLGIDVTDISQTGAMKVVPDACGFDLIPMRDK